FEFFPPKDEAAEAALFRDVVPVLKDLGAAYISVTYGAGGSTQASTLRIVNRIRREFGLEAAAHLTCVGATPQKMTEFLQEVEKLGIDNLLCLRGDPPKGQTEFKPVEGGFRYAVELIRFARARGRHCIGGACYPEGHVECSDKQLDW